MGDKYLMETILYSSRVLNDLYLHASIEASNEKIVSLFHKVINETLKLHNDVFQAMVNAGFYSLTNVDESKILEMKQKLECTCESCDCEEN